MRSGETLEQALFRELNEEIGITQAHVTIVGQTERWLRYRLPPRYIAPQPAAGVHRPEAALVPAAR